jgi:peptidoglycan/xylan/chitin deacetylase (PgdA/CDA1 family)
MRIPGVKTAKRVSKWIGARLFGGALILGYHRVADPIHDEYEICVSPAHFAEHLEILRKHAHPLSLLDLVQHLNEGTLPPKAVAVTFDDGYADNLQRARPLLQQYEIPATVFVSTDFLGKAFWWDELAWLINSPGTLPDALKIEISGGIFEWRVAASTRTKLVNSLHRRLFSLNEHARESAIDRIRKWSGAKLDDIDARRALTPVELLKLGEGGLVDIGSHTMTHPVLSALTVEQQRREISTSRNQLEEILNRPVVGFAYPNGVSTPETRKIVRESGYQYACSSEPDLARGAHQLYRLPRFWPQDLSGDQFIQSAKSWLDLS